MQIQGGFVFQVRHGVTGKLLFGAAMAVRSADAEYETDLTEDLAEATRFQDAKTCACAFASLGMQGSVNLTAR